MEHTMRYSVKGVDSRRTPISSALFSPGEHVDTMRQWRKVRICTVLSFTFFLSGVIYLGYFCPDRICAMTPGSPTPPMEEVAPYSNFEAYRRGEVLTQNFDTHTLHRDYDFDIEGDQDVLVFLHIQKTGGTQFGKSLVKKINLQKPCRCTRGRKRCDCTNSKDHWWLFSRFSTGWRCGLHADWTELQSCVHQQLDQMEEVPAGSRKRRYRYLYFTILRDPVQRYLSEYRHVNRGATWVKARLRCNGRDATLDEMPFCYSGDDWQGVSLEEFLGCNHNLANNRQTRMLANLSLVHCYDRAAMPAEKRDQLLLQSAKENLKNMAFFGLTEQQTDTQYMFEHTFHLNFIEDFVQYNSTHASETDVDQQQYQRMLELNKMDIELYQYAKDLFFQRLRSMRLEDSKRREVNGGRVTGGNHPVVTGRNNNNNKDISDLEEREGEENYDDDDDLDNHKRGLRSNRQKGHRKRRDKSRKRYTFIKDYR